MEALELARLLTVLVFAALAIASFRRWRQRRSPAAAWVCVSFSLIAIEAFELGLLPDQSDSEAIDWLRKLSVAVLALFPYSLYRFTTALRPAPRALDRTALALTAAVVLATLLVPADYLEEDAATPGWFDAYVVGFVLDWTFLSALVAVGLWSAGRTGPRVARRRTRTLAVGAIGLNLALVLGSVEPLDVATDVVALASALLFFVGFVSPRALPAPLGGDDRERFRGAVAELMGAVTREEITRALLLEVSELVGARGAALLDRYGEVLASHGVAPEEAGSDGSEAETGERVELRLASSTLVIWTSPLTLVFGRQELATLTSLGRLAELALERSELHERERRAHQALRQQIDFSRMLVDSSVDGILAFDKNYRYTLWNQGMERISGVSRADALGRSAFEVFPFLKEIGEDHYFSDALAGREATSTDRRFEVPTTGREGFFESRYAPLHGSDGEVIGGLAIVSEITDRKRAEDEREQRRREELARAEAEARNRMVESLQAVTDTALGHLTLDDMVTELLDRITDMVAVDMAALALFDEEQQTLVIRAARGLGDADPEGTRVPLGGTVLGRVAAERRPVVIDELRRSDTVTSILQQQGIESVMAVPLLIGGRLVGALAVGTRRQHHFSAEDTGWLQLAGDRVALAVEHAAIYEREHRIAETLQRSLLPERLPSIPGVAVAARYLAGGAGAVGGDWYDAIPLPRGRLGLAMGDVVGHGIGAASLMGQMRSALRAYALEDGSPAQVLRRLDRLLESMGPTGMATLLYLVFDPDAQTARFASAGHPPPVVRDPEGSARFLGEEASVPLGVQSNATFDEECCELSRGATLVLYTDGLIERRGATLDEGMRRLENAVASAPESAGEVCDHVIRELLPDDPADDTALLVVQAVTEPVRRLRLRPPAEPRSLATVRNALGHWLNEIGLDRQRAYEVLVACGEACANAIEHAYGPGEASFEVEACVEDGSVTISVRDFGRWRTPRGQERGRGLDLMKQLMDTAEVNRDENGTTVRLSRALSREMVG